MRKYLDHASKLIRIVTIPPVMALALLLFSYYLRPDIYHGSTELLLSILFLAVVPVLAYPLAFIVPKYRKKGREGQRNLAFILNAAGYLGVVIWGLVTGVTNLLRQIHFTYFFSVCILIIANKLVHLRASGHSCSIAGPLILLVYFLGWAALLPCALVFALIAWASLRLKRHTLKELLMGAACAATAFAISFIPMLLPF